MSSREASKHTETQFRLIELGRTFGCEVWVASNDRGKEFRGKSFAQLTLENLPELGSTREAQKIMERIDVIWLQENVVQAAFEIETTTSIYSGLLRLSDLLSLLPNLSIPIYIASPEARYRDVVEEVTRPTFKRLRLHQICRFIAIEELEREYEGLVRYGSQHSIQKVSRPLEPTTPTIPKKMKIKSKAASPRFDERLNQLDDVGKEVFSRIREFVLQLHDVAEDTTGRYGPIYRRKGQSFLITQLRKSAIRAVIHKSRDFLDPKGVSRNWSNKTIDWAYFSIPPTDTEYALSLIRQAYDSRAQT